MNPTTTAPKPNNMKKNAPGVATSHPRSPNPSSTQIHHAIAA
jgi:hypothetical protein